MWVGISIKAEVNRLNRLTRKYFYPENVLVSEEFPDTEWPEIFIKLDENDSEFPLLLNLYKFEADEDKRQNVSIALAKYLSESMNCKTICDGTGFGDDDSPYWSIVWDNGVAYLADDCGSTFGDGKKDKPVLITRKIEVKTE